MKRSEDTSTFRLPTRGVCVARLKIMSHDAALSASEASFDPDTSISGGPLGISACGGAGLSRGGPSLTPTSTQLGEEEVSRYFLIVGQDQDL